VADQ
jgi:hypothetical protein